MTTLEFTLPAALEASRPPEPRDQVRLLVARRADVSVEHRRFTDLVDVLEPGDVLVVNTSATLAAAVRGAIDDGRPVELHLSTQMPGGLWVVELRHVAGHASTPWLDAETGAVVRLPAGATASLVAPASAGGRLWFAILELPESLLAYLARWGKPIRYGYVPDEWPIGAYQTVFADEPGSAEMPSAARPFSAPLVTRLVSRGVAFAPFVLHTGVSSLEAHEPPQAEWFRVGLETAEVINRARGSGHRVIAVGTTAVRALESVVDARGAVHPGQGWTEVVVTAQRGATSVDGLITGWHEPQASHLAMLEAIAGPDLLDASYRAALEEGYLWHEFGDSHLILP
ncbi:MAG: S-adenosylmethionine:tRNA ribosyltransferase-isomerase [Acidimicrobiales bacterium]